MGRALAAQGFVVYSRLSAGARGALLRLHARPRPAVRWARDNAAAFGGDGRRITLVGHSAGAYNAAMLRSNPGGSGRTGRRCVAS